MESSKLLVLTVLTVYTTYAAGASEFVCQTQGMFPDSIDCKKYHYCNAQLKLFNYSCPTNGYFDQNRMTCKFGDCPVVAPKYNCTGVGYFPDPQDCHGYFYCDDKKNATHSTCTQYGRFNKTLGECVYGNCTNEPSTTTTTTTTTTPKTSGFVCTSVGLFPDPFSCQGYYICNRSMIATRGSCPEYTHFDSIHRDCEPGNCAVN